MRLSAHGQSGQRLVIRDNNVDVLAYVRPKCSLRLVLGHDRRVAQNHGFPRQLLGIENGDRV
jgi:hypothetical protein